MTKVSTTAKGLKNNHRFQGLNVINTSVPQSDQFGSLLIEAQTQPKAFARFLTLVERLGVEAYRDQSFLSAPRRAIRLGITGPPGAGKSTLVDKLLREFKSIYKKIGVIAVDPSSPFSKGAILGDRIRYSDHFLDPQIFIRSVGSRGSLGGISGAVHLMLRAFDACDFDVVLIETVGVGQTELDILYVADQICVVLVPESGDSIQAMKAGLLEIADAFIVNKADRPGADSLVKELHGANEGKPIFKTIATQGRNLEELIQFFATAQIKPQNLREEAKALLRIRFEDELEQKVSAMQSPADFQKIILDLKP